MLKICGITYTHTSNFGSCLQAYALQTAIENCSISEEKFQYYLIPIGKIASALYNGNSLKDRIRSTLSRPIHDHYRKPFEQFEKDYIHYADCPSIDALPSLNNSMDAFVCGSDVIWNPRYNKGVSAFYLDFANKYKFSYAASFGGITSSIIQDEKIGDYLSNFNDVSVREKQGISIVKHIAQKSARVDVDPVLLLDKEHWDQLTESKRQKEKYIFVYSVGIRPIFKEFVKSLKEKTGLKVIESAANANTAFKMGLLQTCTPQQWLQYIRDAEYIVTNSFHGTVFSMIFQKKFFVPVNGELNENFNIRMYNLLSQVDMEKRMFNSLPEKIDFSYPDYSRVKTVIDKMRADSTNYLHENLRKIYDCKYVNKMK